MIHKPYRPKRDYSDVRYEVIRLYKLYGSILKVSRKLFIAPMAVSKICHEEGLVVERKQKRKILKVSDESCCHCRKYSRTTPIDGYCFKHKRQVLAAAVEHCFIH